MQVPAEDDNDDDFEKRYNMDAYDDEEEDNTAGGLDGLMAHADPRDDKYLRYHSYITLAHFLAFLTPTSLNNEM